LIIVSDIVDGLRNLQVRIFLSHIFLLAKSEQENVGEENKSGRFLKLVDCAALLAGLRFEHSLIYHLMPEEIMEESVIYQDILENWLASRAVQM
jgi:hypothetical protein